MNHMIYSIRYSLTAMPPDIVVNVVRNMDMVGSCSLKAISTGYPEGVSLNNQSHQRVSLHLTV